MCSPHDGDQKNNGLLQIVCHPILEKNAKADHGFYQKTYDFLRHKILTCVDSLGYSEHSDVIDSTVAPTTAEIRLLEITILTSPSAAKKLPDKMVHISATVHAIAKLFTPMYLPRDGNHQKIMAC